MIKEITYKCSIDNSMQKAKYYKVESKEPRPLLVALHTWSAGCEQNCDAYFKKCVENQWNMIFPEFRGSNDKPDACGSEKVVADIVDAVKFVKVNSNVDEDKIYLVGGSGGGHATLLVAGQHPEIWAAASAWCPISDIAAWHREKKPLDSIYYKHIELSCSGSPEDDCNAALEAKKRSPLTYLKNAKDLPLDINTGIHDGHTGSVPISHAINAFNILANDEDKISQQDIDFMVNEEKVPLHLQIENENLTTGGKKIHLRRNSNLVRLTLFEGGHDILVNASIKWLENQTKNQAPNWTCSTDDKDEKAQAIFH